MSQHPPIARQLSADARALSEFLLKAEGLVTYESMQRLTGRDVAGRDHYVLVTAVRECRRQGRNFGAVRGKGVRPLSDIETIHAASAALPSIRRKAKRAIDEITAIGDFDALPNEAKVQHNAALSLFGALAHMTSNAAFGQIEARVAKASQTLALTQTLDVFR